MALAQVAADVTNLAASWNTLSGSVNALAGAPPPGPIGQQLNQLSQQIASMQHSIDWNNYCSRVLMYNAQAEARKIASWSQARALNATAHMYTSTTPLMPFDMAIPEIALPAIPPPPAPGAGPVNPPPLPGPLPALGAPHPQFPATIQDMRDMSLARVNALGIAYGVTLNGLLAARRIQFARFIGTSVE
ncbi:hypothetical protein MKEN_00645600 [Mycena kentingensis (nom. inval.)]|nr:hypothetical protein MKEN_00645600 [Mycena kentingensis (nom. inval.)]